VSAWPVPVDELIIVGHSMGGLVARSACHYGQEAGLDWTERVRHVVFLGSPHLGAPLEKVTNVAAWLLGLTDVTRPFADALNTRSAGIKDLRFGAVLDDHWRDADLDALLENRTGHVPLLPGANHYFVAATVTRDARHPVAVAIGDLLVRRASAFGRGRVTRLQFPIEHSRHVGPMHHLALLNHPVLYEQMRRWIAPRAN
jgi:pimeloyl-ACP methyl ester carboxylesterase